jgi:hypothetical protein
VLLDRTAADALRSVDFTVRADTTTSTATPTSTPTTTG